MAVRVQAVRGRAEGSGQRLDGARRLQTEAAVSPGEELGWPTERYIRNQIRKLIRTRKSGQHTIVEIHGNRKGPETLKKLFYCLSAS